MELTAFFLYDGAFALSFLIDLDGDPKTLLGVIVWVELPATADAALLLEAVDDRVIIPETLGRFLIVEDNREAE